MLLDIITLDFHNFADRKAANEEEGVDQGYFVS
jgi:hypothetical protein